MALKDLFIKKETYDLGEDLGLDYPDSTIIPEPKSETAVDTAEVVSVDDIYAGSTLKGEEGIYGVVGFLESLPESMDKVLKSDTLTKILTSAGKNPAALREDSEARVEILTQYSEDTKAELEAETVRINTEIAQLEKAIENAKALLQKKVENTAAQAKMITEEITYVRGIASYIKE